MDILEIYSGIRALIGNPDPNEVTDRELDKHIIPALEWMVAKLKYTIETEEHLPLVADQQEYIIPRDAAWIIWVEWDFNKLTPSTHYRWERQGIIWRNQASGVPTEFAIQGRRIILLPPPSSSAVSTNPWLIMRYINSTPGLDASGTPQLSDLDQQLVLYRAAVRYLRAHPSDENMARIQGYNDEINDLIPAARDRARQWAEDYYPHMWPHSDRFRGAR